MKKFLKDNFVTIVFILIILGGFKSCSDSRRITKMDKTIETLITKSHYDIVSEISSLEIKIELLKSEKSGIQRIDRKVLDVNRESEIDKQISIYESRIKDLKKQLNNETLDK